MGKINIFAKTTSKMAFVLSVVILLGYLLLIRNFAADWLQILSNQKKIVQVIAILSLLVPGILLYFILKDERFIYYWDFSGYWNRAITFTELFFASPFAAMEKIYNSIRHDEYNVLPNLLLAPFNKILGLKFEEYVFSVYLVYGIPLALIISNFLIRNTKITQDYLKLLLPFICLLFTPLLIPMRFGFVDVIGLLPIFMVLSLLERKNYLRQFNYKASIYVGLLILILVFSRRWYAFWATAFYLSVFLINCFYALWKRDSKIILNATLNLTIAGIVPLSIMVLFFYPFFEMSVLKDYSDIYTAYNRALPIQEFYASLSFFGTGILILALLGFLFFMKQNKSLFAFLLLSTTIIIVLFSRINDFGGYQHYYLLLPLVFILFLKIMLGLAKPFKYTISFFVVFLLVNNLLVFGWNENPENHIWGFSSINGSAHERSDYDAIIEISKDVERLSKQGNYVYVLASTGVLNDNIVKNTKLPDQLETIKNLKVTQHVDKRNQFPNDLFLSNYVIVTNPVQVHLGVENQLLIAHFNEEILHGNLNKHYKKIKTYQLQDNIEAYLMQKSSGLSEEEIEKLRSFFKEKYPDYPNMYAVNEPVLTSSKVLAGDGYGKIFYGGNRTLNIMPGNSLESSMTFDLSENKKMLEFTAEFKKKEEINKHCNPDKDGEVFLTISSNDELVEKFYLTHKKDSTIKIDLSNYENIKLTVDKGKNESFCDWFWLRDFRFSEVTQE